MKQNWIVVLVIGVFIATGFGIFYAIRAHQRWAARCEAQGAHVDSHTDWHTTFSTDKNGNVTSHQNANTTYYCISSDGRLLGIR